MGVRRLRGRHAALVSLGALVAGALGWIVAPARADLSQFEARAAADGVRVGVLAPGASLFDQLADGGVPVAQSVLTGLGTSEAFASMPYPGDVGVAGPTTASALLGTPAPPPYPFIVQSSHPNVPESTISEPGFELKARSDAASSIASATGGGATGDSGVTNARALASSTLDGETLVAEATSVAELVSAGGVVRLGQVFASAKASRDKDGTLTRASDFHADGLSVAGVTLGIGPGGLTLPGTNAPLPDDSALREVLQQSGIGVTYLEPTEDETGIVSAGLRITQVQDVNGTTATVTYTLGRASAHAGAAAGDAVPAEDTGALDLPASVGADLAVASPDLPSGGVSQPTVTPSAPAPRPTPSVRRAVLAGSAPLGSRSSIYLIIVIAAAVGVGATQLFRVLGVRLAWRF